MSRPTNTPPEGAKFSISIPAGWYAIVTAVSRKPYLQGVKVAFDIIQPETRIFGSKLEDSIKLNKFMMVTLDQTSSLPFITQKYDYKLELAFYFSETRVGDVKFLVKNDRLSGNINILKTDDKLVSYSDPDCVTFFVFVEDTPTQETGTGRYGAGLAIVHVFKVE